MFGLLWIFNRLLQVIVAIHQFYNNCRSETLKFNKFLMWRDNLLQFLNQVSELNFTHKHNHHVNCVELSWNDICCDLSILLISHIFYVFYFWLFTTATLTHNHTMVDVMWIIFSSSKLMNSKRWHRKPKKFQQEIDWNIP